MAKEKVENILDGVYENLIDLLDEANIDYDASCGDCIFFNDKDKKKTYVLRFDLHECEYYEGD